MNLLRKGDVVITSEGKYSKVAKNQTVILSTEELFETYTETDNIMEVLSFIENAITENKPFYIKKSSVFLQLGKKEVPISFNKVTLREDMGVFNVTYCDINNRLRRIDVFYQKGLNISSIDKYVKDYIFSITGETEIKITSLL